MRLGRFTSTMLGFAVLVLLSTLPALRSQSIPGAGSIPSTSSVTGKLLDINSASADQLIASRHRRNPMRRRLSAAAPTPIIRN